MSKSMKRPLRISAAVFMFACVLVGLKFFSMDAEERSCGITNAFKADYSPEIVNGVTFNRDASDTTIDFRKLNRWRTVCLTSLYTYYGDGSGEITLNAPGIAPLQIKAWHGRSRCTNDNPRDVRMLLLTSDGSALLSKVILPADWRDVAVETNYETTLRAQFKQCAPIQDAVARCVPLPGSKNSSCIFLFKGPG